MVHLNQSWDRDWRASAGEVRRGAGSMLDVALPAGKQRVELRYRPQGLVAGTTMTLLGLLGAVAFFAWMGRRRPAPAQAATRVAPRSTAPLAPTGT